MATPDEATWDKIHASELDKIRELFREALMSKSDFYMSMYGGGTGHIRYPVPEPTVIVLEWHGWKFVEKIYGAALGSEFYRELPNGKRGLFKASDRFTSSEGYEGILYNCIEEGK